MGNEWIDDKGNELAIGDFIYLKDSYKFKTDHQRPGSSLTCLVAQIIKPPGHTSGHRCIAYPFGWNYPESPTKTGWWNLDSDVCLRIPTNLIEKGDKKLIASFIRLEGYEIEETHIFLPD